MIPRRTDSRNLWNLINCDYFLINLLVTFKWPEKPQIQFTNIKNFKIDQWLTVYNCWTPKVLLRFRHKTRKNLTEILADIPQRNTVCDFFNSEFSSILDSVVPRAQRNADVSKRTTSLMSSWFETLYGYTAVRLYGYTAIRLYSYTAIRLYSYTATRCEPIPMNTHVHCSLRHCIRR